jgi:hypothetical protein
LKTSSDSIDGNAASAANSEMSPPDNEIISSRIGGGSALAALFCRQKSCTAQSSSFVQ